MKKAVKRICNLMDQVELRKYYKPPNQDTSDSICMSAQGDIRNAVINIHFASLKGILKFVLITANKILSFNFLRSTQSPNRTSKNRTNKWSEIAR